MREIVCLSTANFHPFPTRKQNVMTRLSDAAVLYFEPPVTLLAPLKDKSVWPRLIAYRKKGEKVTPQITVYATPPVLPFFNKFRWINRLNQSCLARYVRRRMKAHGFTAPCLWCYSPTSCDAVAHIPHSGLVYDCVDRHSAYPGFITSAVVDRQEEDLARQCDMVFCTAVGLYETLIRYNTNTAVIPNGANYELFAKAAGDNPVSDHPIFCFVGMLQECIAYDYLLALADAFPKGEIRLYGKALPGVDLTQLQAKENIRLMGLLPQDELPAAIRCCDVCLNLFSPGKLSKDVSPLKFYEYLATGKPLVSTCEPLQVRDFADIVYIAEDIPSFLAACQQALAEDDPALRARRMEAGRQTSWDVRVQEMEKLLKEKGVFA